MRHNFKLKFPFHSLKETDAKTIFLFFTPPHSQCFLCLTNFGQCFYFLSSLTFYPKQQGKKETNNQKPEWKAQEKEISNSCLHWIIFSGYWWEEGGLEMSNKVLPSFTRLTTENGHFIMTHLTDVLVSLCFAYSWNITPDILSQIQACIYCNYAIARHLCTIKTPNPIPASEEATVHNTTFPTLLTQTILWFYDLFQILKYKCFNIRKYILILSVCFWDRKRPADLCSNDKSLQHAFK